MTPRKFNKTDSDQILLFLNEAQKLVVQVRSSSVTSNNSMDITAINPDEADQPDPLRVPEVIIIICVLLLWCGSIFIFIRHSELLRIRHRDLPYRSYMKPPMNLNHITVVRRTSDMVIHSKPRFSAGIGLASTGYNHNINEYQNSETMLPSHRYLSRKERQMNSFDSNVSVPKSSHHDEQYLDPYMISSDIQRSLLDLHRKSMDNISTARYSMSFSTNDVSTCKQNDEQQSTVDERCIQESPV